VIFLLGKWTPHSEYQAFVIQELNLFAELNPLALLEYEILISKLFLLDLDPLKTLLYPRYASTGRPSHNQPEIFRSFIIMNHLKLTLDQWIHKVQHNHILKTIAGFDYGKLPSVASYYDFINRLIHLDERPKLKEKKRKPSKKVGKGKKLPPKRSGSVQRFVNQITSGRRLERRPERLLQEIFAGVCVKRSIELGLINSSLNISGDGTCIKTGASHFGVKTCECTAFQCNCTRRFSDPNATWGWDSHKDQWFYGYTGYFISTYNKALKLDLPIYLRLVDAKRHDSITAVVALAEFRDLYPNLKIESFISDSASDNYPTYELLNYWGINAVIDLNPKNKGNFKFPTQLHIDDNGTPICPGGHKMINWGFQRDRCRIKWRCPRVLGKAPLTDSCSSCSTSSYGRVIYTKTNWDLRLFTKIPRRSPLWISIMKERTAAERVNNRILNHYGIEHHRARGKKRISFFTMIASFNVHLDAQLNRLISIGKFDFSSTFNLKIAA